MNKEDVLNELQNLVDKTSRFIEQSLLDVSDVNHEALNAYLKIFTDFRASKNINDLVKYRNIAARPSAEGAKTDYTEGTSISFEGQYVSLMELFDCIEDLVKQYYELV